MVLEAMKRTMDGTMNLEHSRYVVDLMTELTRKQIGTSNVESLCNRACDKLGKNRERTMVRNIMMWKLKDAKNVLRNAKIENTKIWRREKRILIDRTTCYATLCYQYIKLWSIEKIRYAKELNNKRKSKVEFLTKKYMKVKAIPDVLRDIVIKDQEIPETFSSEPRCYGGIELNEHETAALKLPPKFAVYTEINPLECETQVEKGLAKLRWAIKAKQADEGNGDSNERTTFKIGANSFDFREMRSPDLPFNGRIKLPAPLDDAKEIEMHSLKEKLKQITNETCEKMKGKEYDNLTQDEQKGSKALRKKVKEGDVVIFQTDKSGRFAVDTPDNYR